MRNRLFIAAATLALSACGGDSGSTTEPLVLNITGTWIENYTATVNPGVVFQAVLQISQSGANVSGTITTNAPRSANVSGLLSGTRFTGTSTFTDGCTGTASNTADVTPDGKRITGNYTANDCLGSYSGGFVLDKQ